ncbi:hypothetical protein P3S68_022155 [Capsicum galapagoense]
MHCLTGQTQSECATSASSGHLNKPLVLQQLRRSCILQPHYYVRNKISEPILFPLATLSHSLGYLAGEDVAKKLKEFLRRKEAESIRLSELEKRQKQRVEEMRETQKKDLENMKLKEQIRAEVGKEISKIEMTCRDMASVLRGLGITVGNGTSREVCVAYKKALMKFHPDKTSRSDIRQQVEAEEKFKLISRMKDKFLPNL